MIVGSGISLGPGITINDPLPPVTVQYVLIAGGGSGGYNMGGGGGAGGYLSTVSGENSGGGTSAGSSVIANRGTSWTITVGAGGPYQRVAGTAGSEPEGTSEGWLR